MTGCRAYRVPERGSSSTASLRPMTIRRYVVLERPVLVGPAAAANSADAAASGSKAVAPRARNHVEADAPRRRGRRRVGTLALAAALVTLIASGAAWLIAEPASSGAPAADHAKRSTEQPDVDPDVVPRRWRHPAVVPSAEHRQSDPTIDATLRSDRAGDSTEGHHRFRRALRDREDPRHLPWRSTHVPDRSSTGRRGPGSRSPYRRRPTARASSPPTSSWGSRVATACGCWIPQSGVTSEPFLLVIKG